MVVIPNGFYAEWLLDQMGIVINGYYAKWERAILGMFEHNEEVPLDFGFPGQEL